MRTINMLSSATKVKAQGVSSAYIEQVNLVKNGLKDNYEVKINKFVLCDIMHYHTIDPKFFLSMPFSKINGTSVAYVHFVPETLEESIKLPPVIKKIFYKYVMAFYKNADHLVVVNPYFIEVLKSYNIDENKITYIPNFVSDKNFYNYDEARINSIKAKYDVAIEKFVVLGVGQVQSRKGVLDFIETANSLPQVQFIWAGGFSFGAITEGYKELKKVMENPPANVKFIGIIEREQMNDIYNISDLMFLPSYSELFPMSVLESMALKIPILLRDLDIYHNILFDYYLKGKNVSDFSDIIHNLMMDKEFHKTWSDKSLKCHELYSENYVLNMWKEFYEKIYSNRKKAKHRSHINA